MMIRRSFRFTWALSTLIGIGLLLAPDALSQTEKLGVVKYTPPKGFAKSVKENVVGFSEIDEKTGKFCIITLYGATPGTGKAKSDFAREWNHLVVTTLGAPADPKTETDNSDGWTATAGGSVIDFQGSKAFAFLTVLSETTSTVSILGVFNDESYLPKLVAFSSTLDIEKQSVAANPPQARQEPPARQAATATMNVNALAREFQDNEVRANQTWIGKRVRVNGIVNSIQIVKDGNIELTFKTSITNYNMAKCHFNKSQSAAVATLTAHTEGTVEGTVRGLGGGFDNSKTFFVLENCTVP